MAQFNVTMPATNSSDPVTLRRYIGKLVEELRYTLSNLDDSNISRAGISLTKIQGVDAELARITQAEIGKVKIGAAQIQDLKAQVAQIVTAVIQTAVIDWAQIEELHAAIIRGAPRGSRAWATFTLAEVKNLLAEALALEQGTAESMYITNLAVTSANLLSAMLGKLVLEGRGREVLPGDDRCGWNHPHPGSAAFGSAKSKPGKRKAGRALWTPAPTLLT